MPEALASWSDTPTREAIVSFTEAAAARLRHDAGAEQAVAAGFTVTSMRHDWSTVFGE
jgi:hypothetical protein